MRPIHRWSVLALAALLLAACGFKGDLVKPGEEATPEKAGTTQPEAAKG